MRRLIILTFAILASCSDARCDRDKFYCLGPKEQKAAIKRVSDQRLQKLADIDEELSNPPSAMPVYELLSRGEDRARNAYYQYSSGKPLDPTLDSMTRIFSTKWDVCGMWSLNAPASAIEAIKKSCYRVFEEPIDLEKAVKPN